MRVVKPKKCKECGKMFAPARPLQSLCSYECSMRAVYASQKKALSKQDETLRKTKIEIKSETNKTVLQTLINSIVREIDKGCPCISCGLLHYKMQAGHYYAVGSTVQLRYHLLNNFLQCPKCNGVESGNGPGYADGITKLFGLDMFDYIRGLRSTPVLNMNADDYSVAIKIARLILKEIRTLNESSDLPRTPALRISLREQYNQELNIYK